MFKRFFFAVLLIFVLIPTAFAADKDFSQMSPTVKVTSYKKLFIDQILTYGSGSGTVISADGLVLTNHHVIFDDATQKTLDTFEICITFDVQKEPACEYTARLIAQDKDLDIALLQINKEDIYGKGVPALQFLDYRNPATPKEQTRVQIVGYPGSGGKTITITQGQISGFEEFNSTRYFKTDTDFDHGSSGGTALDSDGNFVGIPTYIRSYAENVGYFLDLREAQSWINESITKTPQANRDAERLLIKTLARFARANQELFYLQETYPFLKTTLPAGWEFLEINDENFFASQKNLSNPVGFSVYIAPYQFTVGQDYMDKLEEELERIKESFPDYKKEAVTFAGQDAWRITYTSMANKNTTYYIPYGYVIVGLSYSIDLDEADKQTQAIEAVLAAFQFTGEPIDEPALSPTLEFSNPPFSLTSMGDWRLQKNNDSQSDTLLAEGAEKGNFEGSFAIYYDQVPKDERHLSGKERLDNITKNMGYQKLVYKNDAVSLGGLSGFLYTYEYEGQKYQQIRKHLIIKLLNGEYEFTIEYDDLTADFDRNLPIVQQMLDSFRCHNEESASSGKNAYGNLGFTFNDIQFHRFALAISDLAEKEIVKGYADGGFHPEQIISRAEALKMILESKNHLENEKGSKKSADFTRYQLRNTGLWDVKKTDWFSPYVSYALEKNIAEGYSNNAFRPTQTVNLAEALKMILTVYEIPLWEGATNPWYKKYMDKGFELGLIPYGLYDPNHQLTRAELAYFISTIYRKAKM